MSSKTEKTVGNTAKKITAEAEAIAATVDSWFAKHFHNNKISQDEVSYEIAHKAKEDLKAILTAPTQAKSTDTVQ